MEGVEKSMRIVENGLVPVYGDDGSGKHVVNARELHEFLQSGWQFANWIQDRIDRYSLMDGRDFLRESVKTPSGGRPRVEYWLTVGVAKELCMVENNDQGKKARLYFIEMEERAKQLTSFQNQLPRTFGEALRQLADEWDRNQALEEQKRALQGQVQVMTPKAEFHDRVAASVNCVEIGEFAKAMGTGQNRLFKWLRQQKILMANNHPYQEHLEADHFRLEERRRTDQYGDERTYFVTVVTGKGQTYLHKRWAQAGNSIQTRFEVSSSDGRLLQ